MSCSSFSLCLTIIPCPPLSFPLYHCAGCARAGMAAACLCICLNVTLGLSLLGLQMPQGPFQVSQRRNSCVPVAAM